MSLRRFSEQTLDAAERDPFLHQQILNSLLGGTYGGGKGGGGWLYPYGYPRTSVSIDSHGNRIAEPVRYQQEAREWIPLDKTPSPTLMKNFPLWPWKWDEY